MAETNIYSKGFDPVVGCSKYVAGVSKRKIHAMQQFQKHGREKPKSNNVVRLHPNKPLKRVACN